MSEVIGPDITFVGWAQTNTGSVVQPKPSSFRLFLWDFKPLTPPSSVHTPNTDPPAFPIEQRCDPTVTVTTILLCQVDDALGKVGIDQIEVLVAYVVLSDVGQPRDKLDVRKHQAHLSRD